MHRLPRLSSAGGSIRTCGTRETIATGAAASGALAAPRTSCVRRRTCMSSTQSPTVSRASSFFLVAAELELHPFARRVGRREDGPRLGQDRIQLAAGVERTVQEA